MQNDIFSPGLDGIMVGETAISDVDGEQGQLIYRGESVESLATQPFLEVCWLVLFGTSASKTEIHSFEAYLAAHNCLSANEIALLQTLPRNLHPMAMLQGVVPLLDLQSKQFLDRDNEVSQGLKIIAKLPALVSAWQRIRNGQSIIDAGEETNLHRRFLLQLNGLQPSDKEVSTLDAAQILQLEHSFNCGTFAGRVCASTEANMQAVVSASIGTLSGRLHGGADQAALEMAAEIGSPDAAAAYVASSLANKQKIMGMGHREYKTVDPRAHVLKPMAAELCTQGDAKQLFETLVAVEHACQEEFGKKGKQIWANVEFYKGAVFHALGVPSDCFTALFAMARTVGYVAHYLEFREGRRLIRPKAKYIGKNLS